VIDTSLPYCTYETIFSNGFYYRGKGRTNLVLSGKYTGSGTRYTLALLHYAGELNSPKSVEITTKTNIIQTYATEAEAYAAEEVLIPIELLADPFCLNMHQGGLKGKYKTPGSLLRSIRSLKKKETQRIKKEKAKAKIALLKKKLKEKK